MAECINEIKMERHGRVKRDIKYSAPQNLAGNTDDSRRAAYLP